MRYWYILSLFRFYMDGPSHKSKLHLLYRMHQVFHAFVVEQVLRRPLEIILPLIFFNVITSLYSIITLYKVLNPMLLFNFTGTMTLITLALNRLLSFALRVTESSSLYSRLQFADFKNRKLTKYGKRALKSSSPLTWRIGYYIGICNLHRSIFLILMNDIIIDAVVNLLVAF